MCEHQQFVSNYTETYIDIEYFDKVFQSFLYILWALGDSKEHAMQNGVSQVANHRL